MAITMFDTSCNKEFDVVIYDDNQNIIPASLFSQAYYNIYNSVTHQHVLALSLDEGVVVNGDSFAVKITDEQMPLAGEFQHNFIVVDSEGYKFPYAFNERLIINPILQSGDTNG